MENEYTDIDLIKIALEEAKTAAAQDEVPVGAVIYDPIAKEIICKTGNRNIYHNDPTAHAEIIAIREACEKLGSKRLFGLSLYVTLEPCTMCTTAISFARIDKLCFGAYDPKGGAVKNGVRFFEQPTCHHRPKIVIGGIEEEACGEILRDFFKSKR